MRGSGWVGPWEEAFLVGGRVHCVSGPPCSLRDTWCHSQDSSHGTGLFSLNLTRSRPSLGAPVLWSVHQRLPGSLVQVTAGFAVNVSVRGFWLVPQGSLHLLKGAIGLSPD